jgi:hypothetical protein
MRVPFSRMADSSLFVSPKMSVCGGLVQKQHIHHRSLAGLDGNLLHRIVASLFVNGQAERFCASARMPSKMANEMAAANDKPATRGDKLWRLLRMMILWGAQLRLWPHVKSECRTPNNIGVRDIGSGHLCSIEGDRLDVAILC